jgi:hypothetical protein
MVATSEFVGSLARGRIPESETLADTDSQDVRIINHDELLVATIKVKLFDVVPGGGSQVKPP